MLNLFLFIGLVLVEMLKMNKKMQESQVVTGQLNGHQLPIANRIKSSKLTSSPSLSGTWARAGTHLMVHDHKKSVQ